MLRIWRALRGSRQENEQRFKGNRGSGYKAKRLDEEIVENQLCPLCQAPLTVYMKVRLSCNSCGWKMEVR